MSILHNVYRYYRQKQLENKAALSLLSERLESLAQMDWEERQVNLVTGERLSLVDLFTGERTQQSTSSQTHRWAALSIDLATGERPHQSVSSWVSCHISQPRQLSDPICQLCHRSATLLFNLVTKVSDLSSQPRQVSCDISFVA